MRRGVVTRQPGPAPSPSSQGEDRQHEEETKEARVVLSEISHPPLYQSDGQYDKNDWEVGLFDCCYLGSCKCVLAFIPCVGDRLVLAEALSEMEGGGSTCFHYVCMTGPVGRTYMRRAYGIKGRAGNDCCLASCCRGCVAAQMLGHVYIAGPPVARFPPTNPELSSNFVAMPREWRHCVCLDPCNVLHILMCAQCTSAAHAAAVTGMPAWIFCCYSCYCVNHHIVRMNYGIPGTSQWNDCLEPFLCLGINFAVFPLFVTPLCSCCYFVQMLENERLVIKNAAERGLPKAFLNKIESEPPSLSFSQFPHQESMSEEPTSARPLSDDGDRPKTLEEAALYVANAASPWVLSYGALTALSFWFRSRLLPWGASSLASHLDLVS